MPAVSRLSVTPVKGTALHSPTGLTLTRNGVEEERRFHLVDARHRLVNGKQHGPLVTITARWDVGRHRLSLDIPGRGPVEGTTAELGEPVTTDFYGRPVAGHLVEGPWSAALTEFVGEPVHLVAVDTPGDAVDVHPVTLVSSATVEHLRGVTPGGERLDHRRFRMLVEVDGCAPHEEDTWVGRRVRLGGATVRVVGPVPRCVVTNESPDTGLVDFSTLKAVARSRGERTGDLTTPVAHLPDNGAVVLGVYATVEEPGPIGIGDRVEPLATEAAVDP
ncbi:MOSC domain-containing protein [Geodermatophilus marinus]|uniref:MOSC domain-containing protein n=1 Tax=Geodermatophilus sp. LHW52908 TaxID=2303986 RepID=UPI000E3C8140|nr:MOSC N-terminal beta barrel domain-containing protein [Geodermatophilus sp. LHW52908]RFU19203.1 MOSC domain-containing protein [Geodermatophilus sp. LHW52908]